MRSVSASQISTWTLCARRHYFEKVLGMPQEETEPMKRGTAAHKTIEDFYTDGTPTTPEELTAEEVAELLYLEKKWGR